MIWIGIDPGANGGIAAVTDKGAAWAKPYSNEELKGLAEFAPRGGIKFCVEEVHAMPGQGVTSMFTFGKRFGYILGVLEANMMPYDLVTPQAWKKEFRATADKQTSIDACRRLFPDVSLKRSERCRKDHDGMAEALLIAEYARRHMK